MATDPSVGYNISSVEKQVGFMIVVIFLAVLVYVIGMEKSFEKKKESEKGNERGWCIDMYKERPMKEIQGKCIKYFF